VEVSINIQRKVIKPKRNLYRLPLMILTVTQAVGILLVVEILNCKCADLKMLAVLF